MDASFITPFVKSIETVFSTMLQTQVTVLEPKLKKTGDPHYDVSGIIGLSGDVTGAAVISFPMATAGRVVSQFTGMEIDETHDDFADAIGELINMVTGGAKAEFKGKKVSISCPSVVVGSDHQVAYSKETPTIAIPCECDLGELVVEVTIKDTAGASALQAAAAATS